jgi:hypothetical protein
MGLFLVPIGAHSRWNPEWTLIDTMLSFKGVNSPSLLGRFEPHSAEGLTQLVTKLVVLVMDLSGASTMAPKIEWQFMKFNPSLNRHVFSEGGSLHHPSQHIKLATTTLVGLTKGTAFLTLARQFFINYCNLNKSTNRVGNRAHLSNPFYSCHERVPISHTNYIRVPSMLLSHKVMNSFNHDGDFPNLSSPPHRKYEAGVTGIKSRRKR